MTQPIAYQIQRILDDTVVDGKPHYLIKWKGYSSLESTWEPIENLLNALDVVHEWKLDRTTFVGKKPIAKSKRAMARKNRERAREDKKKNSKYIHCLSSGEESLSDSEVIECDKKQFDTNDFSFGQREFEERQTKFKSFPKPDKPNEPKKKNPSIKQSPSPSPKKTTITSTTSSSTTNNPKNNSSPSNHSTLTSNQKKHSCAEPKSKDDDINGFKVVGKVTKQAIQEVLWSFDWEEEKICEVLLRDGRRVNMKRDDIRKICPDKLLKYYEKIQNVRL